MSISSLADASEAVVSAEASYRASVRERDLAVVSAVANGLSYREAAKQAGIGLTRVAQLVKAARRPRHPNKKEETS
ncbi:hypothetical protein C5B85_10765 [Pseudoclavibacter sp. AY1F1]|uniref:hypothetical protein n=1 Tax=Pseudoclavibacter sp. AY1F1 TaxID=2080583 RepID=UPI000CE8B7E0|nr:hypothetical protein [Pseudoclavibacter sp. AY1F1]PPF44119.1 hypothetical protein C5B85_10765 [Pseudoclavibacter sp. AY1F1]